MSKTAIVNAIIFTVDKENKVFRDGVIVFDCDQIEAVGHKGSIRIPGDCTIIDGQGTLAVLPGLIDVHTHSSLLKGYTENLPFLDWLPEYQREHKVLTDDDAYWAFMISYLEALKGGTTCILDMYRLMHNGVKAASELGLRANLAPYVADNMADSYFETLDANEKLIAQSHNSHNGTIRIFVGLEHLFYCTETAYKRAKIIADANDTFIHTHSSEFEGEVQAVINHFGKRPIHLFHERGILGQNTIVAHCNWLDDSEMRLFKEYDVRISHCPTSNVKLGGGTLKLRDIESYGIKVGLGTDGSISNNSLSMWEVMKFGSLLQKNLYLDATALDAPQILRMATIDGARVLGLENIIGSLEVGKKADVITVDLWQPHFLPIEPTHDHDPVIWNLIYAARASDVNNVWVNGKHVIAQGKSTQVDENDVMNRVHLQTISLLGRRASTTSTNLIV